MKVVTRSSRPLPTEKIMVRSAQPSEAFDTASPALIDRTDFGLSDEIHRGRELHRLKNGARRIRKTKYYSLYRNGNEIFGVRPWVEDETVDELFFYLSLKFFSLNAVNKTVTAMAVWRSGYPEGFSVSSFLLKYVLTLTGTITSDDLQTKAGARLWIRLAQEAVYRGYSVYVRSTKTEQLKPLSTSEVMGLSEGSKEFRSLWGHGEKHRDRRIVISKTPL